MLICGFMGLSPIHQGKKLNRKTGCGMTDQNHYFDSLRFYINAFPSKEQRERGEKIPQA